MKTIGYVCEADPFKDRKAWSGTIYKLRESIEKAGYRVIWIPYRSSSKRVWLLTHFLRLFNKGMMLYRVYPYYLKYCAKTIDTHLIDGCDILFFPGMAMLMKYVKSNKPFIYYTDATIHDMFDYYWFGLDRLTKYVSNKMERWAIQNCALKISASSWAAKSVSSYYAGDERRNYVLLLGANIDDRDLVVREQNKNNKDHLKILFSGVEWERKGASIAIDTVVELNKRGIPAELIMCGIKTIPTTYGKLPPFVKNLGFLNKNKPSEYKKYIETIKSADLFLLPTKAECAGVVFCEASAYALPCFTYDTGGIPDYVVNGVNGYRLPIGSMGKQFADKIQECYENNELPKLSKQAVEYYRQNLNWDSWSRKFKEIMDIYFKER